MIVARSDIAFDIINENPTRISAAERLAGSEEERSSLPLSATARPSKMSPWTETEATANEKSEYRENSRQAVRRYKNL